jgi:hypothetical protein
MIERAATRSIIQWKELKTMRIVLYQNPVKTLPDPVHDEFLKKLREVGNLLFHTKPHFIQIPEYPEKTTHVDPTSVLLE